MKSLIFVVVVFTCPQMHLCADILHYYSFESDASDAIGSADGSLQNGASVNNGKLVLDGSNDFVEFGEKIVPMTGDFTVAFFSKETLPNNLYVEFISQGISGGPGFYLGLDPINKIRAGDSWLSTDVTYPSDGQFHHIAISVDSALNESTLYLDGIPVAFAPYAITSGSGGNNTRLGRQFDPFDEYLGGELDELRIYDHALTDSEVAHIASVPEPTGPFGRKLLDGVASGGLLSNVVDSDDIYYELDPSPTTNLIKQKIDMILLAESPTASPTSFSFALEAAMIGGPSGDVIQSIELWNEQTSSWDLFDMQAAAITDLGVQVDVTGDLTQYIHPITDEIVAKVKWESPDFAGSPFFWSIDVDQAAWLIQ